jgi:hypothetical protein
MTRFQRHFTSFFGGNVLVSGAWVAVAGYIAINFLYNVTITWLIKHTGTTLTAMISTFKLPVSKIVFCLPLFMGKDAEEFNIRYGMILALMMCGMLVYRFGGAKKEKSE